VEYDLSEGNALASKSLTFIIMFLKTLKFTIFYWMNISLSDQIEEDSTQNSSYILRRARYDKKVP